MPIDLAPPNRQCQRLNDQVFMARILIVDDDADLRAFLKEALAPIGFDVVEAGNGAEALQVQRRTPAQLIITDMFMPDRDGLQTIQDFRATFPDVAIIGMSGASEYSFEVLKIAKQMGAVRIFEKPFDIYDVVMAVREVLSPEMKSA
jgi:DNA-binding NtrC family response regulator